MFGNNSNNFSSGDTDFTGGGSAGGGSTYVPLVDAAATIGSALIQRNESKKSAQRNVWNAKDIADYEFQKNKEMWELQNQYNSPGQQMMRLGQAGLNPNLVYGSGSATGNTAGSPPQYKGRTTDMSYSPVQIPQMLAGYQNFQMRQAQIENVKAGTEQTRERTANETIRNWLLRLQGKTGEFDLERRKGLAPYQQQIVESQSNRARTGVAVEMQRLLNMRQDEQLKLLDQSYKRGSLDIQQVDKETKEAELLYKKYRNQFREIGITESDNLFLRMLIRMLNDTGFDPSGFNPFE